MDTYKGLSLNPVDKTAAIREYPLAPLLPDELRIATEFASIKHGTTFTGMSEQSPFHGRNFDLEMRIFVPREEGPKVEPSAPQFLGNMLVGRVVETGANVTAFETGDRVFCHGPACQMVTAKEAHVHPIGALSETNAVCTDPACIALAATRDARASVGDEVIVFGLGAIGLLAVQLLRLCGCRTLIAVDGYALRRDMGLKLGADFVLDPAACDVGMEVRRLLGGHGVDISMECSGHYKALHQAIRSAGQCARVVTIGFYRGKDTELELGAEFLHNRLQLTCSMPDWNNPSREYPRWDNQRIFDTVAHLFSTGRMVSEGILQPIVPIEDAAAAFNEIARDPSHAIKLGIRF